ncbi:hypothetical protein LIER_32613 [Lithospermum erythrorhizon]|uniref:Uncharacterized protein n=1 Tax=Lithospermum erythrorhizon TaxID=34254 RepID=A0AAV3RXF6_LITER
MDWSPYASGSCYYLTSRGNPDPEAFRTMRYLKYEVFSYTFYGPSGGNGSGFSLRVRLLRCLDEGFLIPESCAFLLQSYHCLSLSFADGRVLITDWINHWSKSPRVYFGPQAAGASGGKTHSLAGCPKGTILLHRDWDSGDRKIFKQLGVCTGLAEETYCTAFLSCWFCLFVLPLEPHGYMRTTVFKMASCIATGTVPRRLASFVFYDHKPQFYEGVTFFLSLHTNMVGFRFGDQFDMEVYHPHHFSRQLCFAPSIPGVRNEIRVIVDVRAGLRF